MAYQPVHLDILHGDDASFMETAASQETQTSDDDLQHLENDVM